LKLGLDTWAISATIVAETTKAGSSKKKLKAGLDNWTIAVIIEAKQAIINT
jgi:hypothetical protein